jgi:Holliday junction DNA helicase RuvA
MIGYLKGKLAVKTPTYIIVECNGVGYHVNISLNTFSKLEDLNEATVFTHLHVREDDMSLYGFFDQEEKSVFQLLISVSGIGTNTARVILSYMNTDEIKTAIMHEDVVSISKVKGIGPKTAKRLILDLKDKIIKESGSDPVNIPTGNNILKSEALSALLALGFPKASVEKNINIVVNKNPNLGTVEEVIKMVLKNMS